MPLESVKPKCLSENEPLAKHSNFKIGGQARYFAKPATEEELRDVIDFSESENLPWRVMGGGCNILFADHGFPGIIISMAQMVHSGGSVNGSELWVPAGLSIPRLGRLCRECGLSGLEFLSQIPGTAGGAAVMNAGFSRSGNRSECVGSFIDEVRVFEKGVGITNLSKERLSFRYRWSNLQDFVVLAVKFKLKPGERSEIEQEMKQNYSYRISVQDLRYPSAGSVFKNPENTQLTVGRMVQNLGLRGKRAGDAQISEIHGNWIVNLGNAKAQNVLELVALVKDRVKKHYGIALELEIKTVNLEEKIHA